MKGFQEWLPIRAGNRVALVLAALSLVVFVIWNCLPYHESEGEPSFGIVATAAWPEFFSPDLYVTAFRSPDMEGIMAVATSIGLVMSALVVLLTVPLWQIFHASPYVRLPLAFMNLLCGATVLWHLAHHGTSHSAPSLVATFVLMALSLFLISAALFSFRNELPLREARSHGLPAGSE